MKQLTADINTIAACGLYCGACKSYLAERCPGCKENAKAKWCGVRRCCLEKGIASCADCAEHSDPRQCKIYNNFISRVIGFVFRSDRAACIAAIRAQGYEAFAIAMTERRAMSMRRR